MNMSAKKLLVALALLVGATSAALAKTPANSNYGGSDNTSGYASGQPGPNSSIESIR
jgi:hypothetical protein